MMPPILNFIILGIAAGLSGSYLIQYLPQRIIREEQEQYVKFRAPANSESLLPPGIAPTPARNLFRKKESWIFSFLVVCLSVWIPLQTGVNLHAFLILLFCWVLLLLACIDWKYQYLPDSLTLPFIWIGLLVQLEPGLGLTGIKSAIWGCVLGYLSLRILAELFFLISRQEGVGHGDMKLLAMIGAWMGGAPLPMIMLTACLLFLGSSCIQLICKIHQRQQYFPFGPFIIAGALFQLLKPIRIL